MNRLLKPIGLSGAVACVLVGCEKKAEVAPVVQDSPSYVMAEQRSPHFEAVASQLEMGGLEFSYRDQGSKNALYAGAVELVVDYLDRYTEFKGVDAQKLVELFTLEAVKASGSSCSQKDGYLHYRDFNYMPEGRSIYSQAYGEAKPSVAMQLAPAGADLVLEMHLNGNYDPQAEEKMYAALGPMGEKLKALQAEQMKGNPLLQKYQDNYKRIDSRITLIGDISPKGFVGQAGLPVSGELLISVTNAEVVWEILKPLIEAQGLPVTESGKIAEVMSPVEMGGWQPYLQYNTESKQLLIGSSKKYAELCLSAQKGEVESLFKDPEIVKLSGGLPEHFSSMAYVSPKFASVSLGMVDVFGVPQVEDTEYVRPAVRMLMDKLKKSDVTKTGTLFVVSFQEQGTLQVLNTPVPSVELGGLAQAYVGVVGLSTMYIGATYYKENADKAACIVNQSMIQKATRSVENIEDHHPGEELKVEWIVGPDRPIMTMPTCPAGGTYTWSPTFPEVGEPAVRCSCEGHQPESTEGW